MADIPIDLNRFEHSSVAVIQRVADYLEDERGVHIESAIAAVGSLAGIAVLRNTGAELPVSEPGSVQVVLLDEAKAQGADVLSFMREAATAIGLDESFERTDVPPGHQPRPMMVQGVLEWVRELEYPCNELLDDFEIEPALRPYAYAYAALKLVQGGEELLDQDVGKALVMAALTAGSKTAPYEKEL